MGYQANQDYLVRILDAAIVESQSGNSGFQLLLNSEHGAIKHTIWVTDRSVEMAKRQFLACGLAEMDLVSKPLWTDPGALLNGRDVVIHTKEEAGQDGAMWTRVAYIKSPQTAATPDAKRRGFALMKQVVDLTGGGQPAAPAPAPPPAPMAATEITDNDLPF